MAKNDANHDDTAGQTPPETPPAAPAVAPRPVPPRQPEPAAVASETARDDGKADYTVTERAGPRVAGRRVKQDQTLRLTIEEARADLLTGAIVPKGKKLHEQLRKGAKPRDPITKRTIGAGTAA